MGPSDLPVRHLLLGEDHPDLGEVVVQAAGPGASLALSAGRLPKSYASVDPNEDALVVVSGPGTTMAAVADGHHGFDAARAAIMAIYDAGERLLAEAGERPASLVRAAFGAAAGAVRLAVARLEGRRAHSETALSIAALSHGVVAAGTIGDTVVAVTGTRRGKVLSDGTAFLGARGDVGGLRVQRTRLRGPGLVVLMSDGAYSFLGRRWRQRLPELTDGLAPEEAAQAVVEAAFAGGSGDHIAVAVLAAAGAL